MSKENIERVLCKATSTDYDEGLLAYTRYHEICKQIAGRFCISFEVVVAVFAALSPSNDYKGNLISVLNTIHGYQTLPHPDYIRVRTYHHCRERALSYLCGVDFLSTVNGQKIKNFYLNIINPEDSEPVTIDGHAVNISKGKRANLKAVAARVVKFQYDEIANEYREVAAKYSLLPNQLQAVTWFTWKRIHKIFYPIPQLHLFYDNSNDLWKTMQTFEDIIYSYDNLLRRF